ncbi:MAG: cation:dicarboxylase symporter family transporter [Aliarcobacter sp.]|nr:cation:dicarboxylase symporter family transporter [Aliarcobacter sp.]
MLTTAIAITIGLAVGIVLEPGVGVTLEAAKGMTVKEAPSLIDTLLNIISKNPFSSFANGDILQIIFFAIILGVSINLSGDKGEPAKKFFNSIAEAMYKRRNCNGICTIWCFCFNGLGFSFLWNGCVVKFRKSYICCLFSFCNSSNLTIGGEYLLLQN